MNDRLTRPRRLFFYVPALDVESMYYTKNDTSDEIDLDQEAQDGGQRRIPLGHYPTAQANAVASCTSETWLADGDDGIHLPCFDLDKMLTPAVVQAVVAQFPDADFRPSITPGHHHVYSDTPLTWSEYKDRLFKLTWAAPTLDDPWKLSTETDLVEVGYFRTAEIRRATFLRLPHITKKEITK